MYTNTRGGYSEDTLIRVLDNGGYARGYHELFTSLTAWHIPLRSRRPARKAVFLCIGALVVNVLFCRIEDVALAHAYAPVSMHIGYRQSCRRWRAKRLTRS
jgi:hypothetical protein